MHNLATVFGFEVRRTLKKKSFWVMSLLFPVMIAAIGGVVFFSNKATDEAVNKSQSEQFTLAITDKSGVLSDQILAAYGAKNIESKQEGIQLVTSGALDAYFYYPDDLTTQSVEVYGQDVGLFDNGRYGAVAKSLLDQSVAFSVSQTESAILQGSVQYQSTTYQQGIVYDGIKQLIAPGIFLLLFYLLIVTFGNQMLASSTEEKENRVIEMILTTVRARTLVIGKIISLVVLGLIQAMIVVVPVVAGYLLFHDFLQLPSVDLSTIPLDWFRIAVGFVIFFASFVLFTGLLVTIGAATPTAKEASSFFGVIAMLTFGPLYAAPLFVSSPDSGIVQFLSYFPLTAPIPLLLRNAVGNLELWQMGIALAILLLTTSIILAVAVRVFRYGALEYSRKLSISEIFFPNK